MSTDGDSKLRTGVQQRGRCYPIPDARTPAGSRECRIPLHGHSHGNTVFDAQTDYRVNGAARRPRWIGYWQKSCLVGNLLGTGDLTAMLRSTVVVAISVAAWVTPSLAQEGPGGDALAAYVDSLERITTADALDRIEPRWNPAVHYFPVVFGRLRLGFYQLRAAQLSGDIADYKHALETFERTTIEAPNQPEAWYAFGLTNIDMRRREFPDRSVTQQHMSGYTRYYLGGREALLQSLAVEPEFMPSLELLLEIVVEEGDRVQPAGVLAAMRTAARLMPDDPRPLLVLGRSDRKEGKLNEALARFQHYGAVGGDPGVARLEASRTLFALDRTGEAVSAYWSGLKYPGPRGRALYRTDLSWVAIQSEISAFDRLEVDSLNAWVTDFWANRDAESVRPTGDRIREHLRRWVLVHRQFRVSRPEGRAPSNPPWLFERPLACTDGRDRSLDGVDFLNPSRPKDLRGWEPFLDNRAPIYMRHGEPIRRVWSNVNAAGGFDPLTVPTLVPGTVARAGFADIEVPATPHDFLARPQIWEAWAFWIDGEPRFFSFAGSAALGSGAPTTLSSRVPTRRSEWYWYAMDLLADSFGNFGNQVRRDLARSRHDALAREAGLPRALPSTRCTRSYQRWLQRSESDMDLAVHTDGYVLFFPANLFPTIQAYGLPGLHPTADGTILVVYSVPLEHLIVEKAPDSSPAVSLRFRISALDSTTGQRLWADTTRLFQVPRQAQAGTHLTGYLEMKAPPGSYAIRIAVQQTDSLAGNAVILPEQVVTWAAGPALELSDLITGRHDDNTLYWFGQEPVLLNPLDTFLPDGTVEVFYVQGGLRPGEMYRTTVMLTRLGKDKRLLSLSFEEVAQHGLESKQRGIALQDLEAGTYRLTLTLQELGTTRMVQRQRILNVFQPK